MVGLRVQRAVQGSFYHYYTLFAFAHIHRGCGMCQRHEYPPEHRETLLRYSCNVSHMSSVAQVTGSYQTSCSVRGTDVRELALTVGRCK